MAEQYAVFYYEGKELAAYTVRGTFSGEAAATIELLAYENNISKNEITISYENR